MMASVGPTVGTVNTWVSRPMMPSEVTRPRTAVRIGRPIAMRLPNVSARMTIAVSRPTASLLSVGEGERALPMVPPAATSMPCFWAGAVASKMRRARSSVTWPLLTFSSTGMKAVRPSVLTSAEEELPNGLVAE